ncbi:MAG: peptide ABC transporter substrate-binding protein [Nitrolancea sp.]
MDREPFNHLYEQAVSGALTRRQVLKRAALLGLSAPTIAALLAACGSSNKSTPTTASASTSTSSSGGETTPSATTAATSTSAASPAASSAATATDTASAGAGRGKGGTLNLLWWQAPTILNGHLAQGTKDFDASRVVSEPLADFDKDGNLVLVLAAEIPSLDNGGVAQDGKSVTWKLKSGVKWSDGEDFTADDVKFTYDYVSNKDTAATSAASYAAISSVDVVDPMTVKVNFTDPTPGWNASFCGSYGYILPQHILKDSVGTAARDAPFNLKPIGTGPYKVDEFVSGDHVQYSINDNFREADKPFFKQVYLKGGGDATSAARAAIQTGEVDYSWNLQVEWGVLQSLESDSNPGQVVISPGASAEQILINMTDPSKEVDGEKSHLGTPHPFQADLAVRQAYSLAIQRDVIAQQLYGDTGTVTSNVLVAPTAFVSQNTSWKYDVDGANKLLDDAGWTKNGNVREKDGVQMNITYSTSVNSLRQKEQEIVKQGLSQIGVNVTIKSVDASVFFASDAGNVDTYAHFYVDIEMFTNGPSAPYPLDYMVGWYGDPSNIAQKSNSWSGNNVERWQNADFDKAYKAAQTELDPTKQADLFIQMNDLVVNNVVRIPEIQRNGVSGANRKLQNLSLSPWTSDLWNLMNWTMSS